MQVIRDCVVLDPGERIMFEPSPKDGYTPYIWNNTSRFLRLKIGTEIALKPAVWEVNPFGDIKYVRDEDLDLWKI